MGLSVGNPEVQAALINLGVALVGAVAGFFVGRWSIIKNINKRTSVGSSVLSHNDVGHDLNASFGSDQSKHDDSHA